MIPFKKVERSSAAGNAQALSCHWLQQEHGRRGPSRWERWHLLYSDTRKKVVFSLIYYLIIVCVNKCWLFSHEDGHNQDRFYLTRYIGNHWRKTYGRLRAKPGPPAAGLSQTLEAALVTDAMRFDKLNHFIIDSEGK